MSLKETTRVGIDILGVNRIIVYQLCMWCLEYIIFMFSILQNIYIKDPYILYYSYFICYPNSNLIQ